VRNPLSRAELEELAALAGGVDQLLSLRSPAYRARQGVSLSDWLQEMIEEPRLIRRPILVTPGGTAVGFDPERWRALTAAN
jgi:arsenate reductase-like glutaredoxin family protein